MGRGCGEHLECAPRPASGWAGAANKAGSIRGPGLGGAGGAIPVIALRRWPPRIPRRTFRT